MAPGVWAECQHVGGVGQRDGNTGGVGVDRKRGSCGHAEFWVLEGHQHAAPQGQ